MRLTKLILIIFIFSAISVHYPTLVVGSAEAKGHKSAKTGKGKKQTTKSVNPGNVWERIRSGIRIPVPNPAAGIEDIVASSHIGSISIPSIRINPSANGSTQNGVTDGRVATVINKIKISKFDSKLSEQLRIRHVLMPHENGGDPSGTDPDSKYTKLGRLLLGSKKLENQLTGQLTKKAPLSEAEKLASEKSDSMFKSSLGRIRTRLGLHHDLSKNLDTNEKSISHARQDTKLFPAIKPKIVQAGELRNCDDLRKKENIQLAKAGVLSASYAQIAGQCQAKQAAINERIAKQLASYSKGFLYEISERARPYLYHIVDMLSKHGLPLDLALLPIMESAYKSTALSPASASGLWQFIPSTGRIYGLEQTEYYDARRDVIASTEAAVHFLASLNAHYKGDWLLALAAYNWGPGNIDAAIAKNMAEGLDTDYWSLEMPEETQNYVPRLLALARIFSNPAGFGLNLRPLKNEPYFIKVVIDRENDIDQLLNKDLTTVGKLANFNNDEFNNLNSAYLDTFLTERKPFRFLMPINNANVLHQSLAFLAKSNLNENHALPFPHAWALSSHPLESKYEMPMLEISLTNNNDIKRFYSNEQKQQDTAKTAFKENDKRTGNEADYLAIHYLDKGESLKSLAEYHGVSEVKLREINKIKRKQGLSLGQRLLIPIQLPTGISLKSIVPSVLYKKL